MCLYGFVSLESVFLRKRRNKARVNGKTSQTMRIKVGFFYAETPIHYHRTDKMLRDSQTPLEKNEKLGETLQLTYTPKFFRPALEPCEIRFILDSLKRDQAELYRILKHLEDVRAEEKQLRNDMVYHNTYEAFKLSNSQSYDGFSHVFFYTSIFSPKIRELTASSTSINIES